MPPYIPLVALTGVVSAFGLLLLTAWLEQKFLSPRFLITRTVRVRNSPEHAERMVALQAEQLLRSLDDAPARR